MEIVLALGAAAAYGTSDFAGGLVTRRVRVLVVIFVSQLAAAVVLVPVVVMWAGAFSWSGLSWGLASGLAGMAGTTLLYKGLAIGPMSVVAPITGVLGAGLPVVFGVASGERPGPVAVAGIVAGLVAVVVITLAPDPTSSATGGSSSVDRAGRSRRALGCAFGSGIGFGLFFILLERAPDDSGMWPLVGTRASVIALVGAVVLIRGMSVRTTARTGAALVGVGAAVMAADLLFLLATRGGLLSLVSVVTSLYPAVTVGLAAIALRERTTGQQVAGLAIAAASVTLIALG